MPWFYANYGPKFMAAKHPGVPYTVCNIGGTSYAFRDQTVVDRVDMWLRQHPDNVLIDDGGANEYGVIDNPPMTWQQVRDVKLAYTEARRAAGAQYIVGLTHTPGIDQIDTQFWFDAPELAEMALGNAAMVADPESFGYDQVIDIASIPQLQDPTNTTYFYDGVHYADPAATLVANKVGDELLV